MKTRVSIVIFMLTGIFLMPLFCSAVEESAISDARHREHLDSYIQNSRKLEEKNLNRFAMEALYQYAKAYDSIYAAEKADTLARIKSQYDADTRSKRELSDSLDIQVKNLTTEKETLRQKYFGLLRKAVIALIIWLLVVAIILYVRTKAMRKNKSLQAASEAALQNYEQLFSQGDAMLSLNAKLSPLESAMTSSTASLFAIQENVRQQIKSGELEASKYKEFQSKLSELISESEKQESILLSSKLQREPESETKKETDINALCKQVLDLAACGMNDTEFVCKASTDFEKRLPKIKVFPQAIGNLLNNLFANSFQSMKDKALTAGKTFKPTLAVSTRVLPRFIQIRIKDNGTGIQDTELTNVLQYFYSMNPPEKGAGLGLAEANRIMKELHNGEISIESDSERGTDVYLKFFTGNEKS